MCPNQCYHLLTLLNDADFNFYNLRRFSSFMKIDYGNIDACHRHYNKSCAILFLLSKVISSFVGVRWQKKSTCLLTVYLTEKSKL